VEQFLKVFAVREGCWEFGSVKNGENVIGSLGRVPTNSMLAIPQRDGGVRPTLTVYVTDPGTFVIRLSLLVQML
jgi:hypothetical protein